ncbi:MAG: serine/threonine protein kinase [Ardenticatenales bacterium]|nr:serine/threonine protein kinase [Ardenticatenales bacterium]
MATNRTLLHRRYRVVSRIGAGGSGAVWLADDQRLPGRQCAVKEIVVPADLPEAETAVLRRSLHAEATTLARLDHPALPKVSDCFDGSPAAAAASGARHYLVMDFVPGRDLLAVLEEARRRDRQIDESELWSWAEALCEVLHYLHTQRPPVIHRDIKPSNIKLTPDGQLKLVDFGLALEVRTDDGSARTVATGAGTRAYQPLEQYGDGAALDARADIYSLGATLYHLLTGRAPASASERFIDPAVLADPRTLRPSARTALGSIAMACLALHPDDRPESIAAVRRLLRAGTPGGSATTAAESGAARSELPPTWWAELRRRPVRLALAAGLAVAAAVLSLMG